MDIATKTGMQKCHKTPTHCMSLTTWNHGATLFVLTKRWIYLRSKGSVSHLWMRYCEQIRNFIHLNIRKSAELRSLSLFYRGLKVAFNSKKLYLSSSSTLIAWVWARSTSLSSKQRGPHETAYYLVVTHPSTNPARPVSQRIWTPLELDPQSIPPTRYGPPSPNLQANLDPPGSISPSGFGPLSRIWTPLLKSLWVTKLHPAIIDCCLNLDKSAGIPRSTQMAMGSAEILVHSTLYSGCNP